LLGAGWGGVFMFKKFRTDIRGNLAITFALGLIPVLVCVGVAIDMVRKNNLNSILQAAADSAALAGATSKKIALQSALEIIVNDYLDANYPEKLLTSVPVVTSFIDPATGAFSVKVTGHVSTTFLGLVGIPMMDIGGVSAVNLGMQGLEVALVLDNTGSMAGTKITELKIAAKNLISILEAGKADYSDLRFALVPFSQYVNVDPANLNAQWVNPPPGPDVWNGCVGSRSAPLDLQANSVGEKYQAIAGGRCPTAVQPLTSATYTINSEIDGMIATGSTYIAGGALWGWNLLTPEAPFTEGRTASQLKAINGRKVMVIMTDGTNTASPLYPNHDGRDSSLADANFANVCSNIKADDIEVFTVLFEEPSPVIRTLMQNCASVPGNFYDTSNGAALIKAFESIARELSDVRIVQ
jgi:Flp pilus assembly protein TadG